LVLRAAGRARFALRRTLPAREDRFALALRAGFAARFFIVFAIAFSLSLSQLSLAQSARITTTCDASKCETNIKPVLIA
jgi:hypothetical protein